MSVSSFMERHFRHFNARETLEAAQAYRQLLDDGGKMLLAIGGAMSTGELGVSLAEMIRQDKVHAISCTAANLEEDLFHLVAKNDYMIRRDYRNLTPQDEVALRDQGFNRVTDTCIPESVIRHIEGYMTDLWIESLAKNQPKFPAEYCYRMIKDGMLAPHYQKSPEDSWVVAACQKNLPIFAPGFEDSTLGNIFAARVIDGTLASHQAVRSGTEQMQQLVEWYLAEDAKAPIGFFQIAGGIAGDFAICAVPLIVQDLQIKCRYWQYFAQISDSTTSYGSYSGAIPSEKITWHKIDPKCPQFMINSDASIVAPLIFAYVLGE